MVFLNSTAFLIMGFPIKWYGILISFGMIMAIVISKFTTKLNDSDYDELINIALIVLPVGIIGARFYYVIFNLSQYNGNFMEMINIREGGLAIHGGLIFGSLAGYIYTKVKKIDFLKMADAIVPGIIFAQAMGRWGNFFNQEAHGGAVSEEFIKNFPSFIQKGMLIEGVYYAPTFLYESIWSILVFVILIFILKKTGKDNNKKGIVAFTYIGLYSFARFFIEGMRTDSLMVGVLRTAQIVSIIGIAVWIISIFYYLMKTDKSK